MESLYVLRVEWASFSEDMKQVVGAESVVVEPVVMGTRPCFSLE
jgi:hypothetical protein